MVVEEGRPLSSAVQSSYTTVGQSKQFWREDWWEGGRTEREGGKEGGGVEGREGRNEGGGVEGRERGRDEEREGRKEVQMRISTCLLSRKSLQITQ